MSLKINMRNKLCLSLFLFLFPAWPLMSKEEGPGPVGDRYYRNEFVKPYFHLGLGFNFGGAYYLNYSDQNLFRKYGVSFKLAQEKGLSRLAMVFKLQGLFEFQSFTDDSSYYGYREKKQALFFIGMNLKLRPLLPGAQSLKPYLLLGGGVTDIRYKHMFRDKSGSNYSNEVTGFGGSAGLNAGLEIELIDQLLSLDLGSFYMVNPGIRVRINPDNSNEKELKDSMNEFELSYYLGFSINLF
jgi:hypothetical protein